MSLRETILAALHARLSALPATALRGEVLPERVPAEGLLILRDGEPGEPEVTLSPLAYHYQHRAEIEAVVQGTARDAAFDTLTASIGTAIAANRTLGGLCDWVEAEAPRPLDLPVEGAASLKTAFGAPTTTGVEAPYSHEFQSGSWTLPSMSIETGMPEVPRSNLRRQLLAA